MKPTMSGQLKKYVEEEVLKNKGKKRKKGGYVPEDGKTKATNCQKQEGKGRKREKILPGKQGIEI